MKHTLQISVSKEPRNNGIIRMQKVCLREKVLRWLFGARQKILVLAPAESVEEVTDTLGRQVMTAIEVLIE